MDSEIRSGNPGNIAVAAVKAGNQPSGLGQTGPAHAEEFLPELNHFEREVCRLHPAYFAMVMATRIVAIAAHLPGMDTACIYRLSEVIDLPFILWIPQFFLYVALVAWLAAYWGLLDTLVRFKGWPQAAATQR